MDKTKALKKISPCLRNRRKRAMMIVDDSWDRYYPDEYECVLFQCHKCREIVEWPFWGVCTQWTRCPYCGAVLRTKNLIGNNFSVDKWNPRWVGKDIIGAIKILKWQLN